MRLLLTSVLCALLTVTPCLAQSQEPAQTSTQQQAPRSSSEFQERLRSATAKYAGQSSAENAQGEVILQPWPGKKVLQYQGDARGLYDTIARLFGVKAKFYDSFNSRPVNLAVGDVDFVTAMDIAGKLTKNFWAAKEPGEFIVAADNSQNRKALERSILRTFYFSDATTPQELNDMVAALRTMLDIRLVTQNPATYSISVRAPQSSLTAAAALLEHLSLPRPQVMLDVQVFEVNSSMLRTIGIDLPLQFQMFNIGSSVLAALGSANAQDLLNRLIASGGINQANGASIAALIAQLQNQQTSLLANPLATFGGGTTLFGIGIPPATVNLSMNESRIATLEQVSVRASQGNPATLHIGERHPVLNASFTPAFTVPGVPQLSQFNAIVGLAPSFTYEDLGLTLKATPRVQGTQAVTLELEMAVKALGAQSLNSIPVIQNREYKGAITVKDGEAAVLAGMISRSEQKSMHGIPGLGHLPILGSLTASDVNQKNQDELIIIMTPHIIRANIQKASTIPAPPSP